MLDKSFWDNRYQTQETQWDLKSVSPPLKEIIDSLDNKNCSILIPGCGNAHEAEYLIKSGFTNITVIDIAPSPVEQLKNKFNKGELNIVLGDFFQHQGAYDLILEQTFLCAIDPILRTDYVKKCHALLRENGSIRGVLFNVQFENPGPHFGGSNEEFEKLFLPYFHFIKFEPCTNSVEKRKGNEVLIELRKKNIPTI